MVKSHSKKTLWQFLRENFWPILSWSIAIILIVWALWPILCNKLVTGWDLLPHFYLSSYMADILKSGQLTGYDPNWFAGYSAFTFYGPLPYVFMVIPHLLSFGTISLIFSFNLFLFLLPFFFLFSIYYAVLAWFEKKEIASFGILFGLLFLFVAKSFSLFGMGIASMLYAGLISSLFALSLLILLIGFLGKLRTENKIKYYVLAILCLSGIILSHAITTIFTGLMLTVLFLCDFKKLWKKLIIIFGTSLVICSFWLIDFLRYLDFSSSAKIGMAFVSSDPLFAIFPNMTDFISGMPFLKSFSSLILLIFVLIGVATLIKTKGKFFVWLMIISLILLPRDYLIYIADMPIHYYRFVPYIFVLNIFIAAYGLYFVFEKLKNKHFLIEKGGKILVGYLVIVAIFTNVIYNFDLKNYPYFSNEYLDHLSASDVINYFKEHKPTGRVLVKTSIPFQDRLGSPHFFNSMIPLEDGVEVIPGLLSESSLTSTFILPAASKLIDNFLIWGDTHLAGDTFFYDQDKQSMLNRLKLYNVEYLVVEESDATQLLQELKGKELTIEKEFPPFTILKLTSFMPRLAETEYKPFLFVDRGGIGFKQFAENWYKEKSLFDYPVIYTNKNIEDLDESEISKIGGLIVSYSYNTAIFEDEIAQLQKVKEDLVILGGFFAFNASAYKDITAISDSGNIDSLKTLKSVLAAKDKKGTKDLEEIEFTLHDDEEFKFPSEKGVLINYSYFPRWESRDDNQTVFWATPTLMFVFGKGENELFYN